MARKPFGLLFVFWSSLASANVPCSLPFNLQNGTIADASQVMANYNALISCLTRAAAAGINSDITSLTGLTSPLSPTFGGTNHFIGGTSSGTNTLTLTVTPNTFTTPQTGWQVSFTVGAGNTGATTLAINGGAAVNVFRPTTTGPTAFVGGEFVTGNRVTLEYDGTQWQWLVPPVVVGALIDFGGPLGCPGNTLPAIFTAVSRTTYAKLFATIGTNWGGGDGSTTFNLPDLRGRAVYGQDQGGSNRITVAGGNFDGTVVGNSGGLQNHTMTGGELVSHTHTITDPGHVHTAPTGTVAGANFAIGQAFTTSGTINTGSAVTNITVNNAGSGNPFTVLGPAAIVTKCIQP